MRSIFCFLFFSFTTLLSAQGIDVNGTASLTGIFSSEDEIPFWFAANTNGAVGSETSFSSFAGATARYSFPESNASIEVGVAGFYRNGLPNGIDELQRRDLYARFQNKWVKATLGSRAPEVLLNGLSATNKNFLLSGNARPLPGILIEANEPLTIFKNVSIDWGIAHYSLNDKRVVDGTRVHYKRLGLNWQFNENNSITARMQHFAQWGGVSSDPDDGVQPDGFSDFIDVFVAKQSGSRSNALGNHLGSYFLEYNWNSSVGDFSFYHEHPFEDGSGTRFANFPDGVWGIFYEPESDAVITSVLYEYTTTKDQSGSVGGAGKDSYFNNAVYSSGWTYDNRTIGLPFITVPNNTRVGVHQLGATSAIKKFQFMLKLSFVQNLGTFFTQTNEQNNVHTFFSTAYSFEKYGTISVLMGYDNLDTSKDVVGGGIKYSYSFK